MVRGLVLSFAQNCLKTTTKFLRWWHLGLHEKVRLPQECGQLLCALCFSYYMNTHLGTEGSLNKVFLIYFIPPQRNVPDLSTGEACTPQDDGIPHGLILYPFHSLYHWEPRCFSHIYRDGVRFIKAYQKEVPALCVFVCLFHLHTSLPPPLMKHHPSEYPLHPWPSGLRTEVGEMGQEPRSGRGMEVCKDSQGELLLDSLSSRISSHPDILWFKGLPRAYQLTSLSNYINYFSIQMPRMGGPYVN